MSSDMKLGICVVYLFDAAKAYLLQMQLSHIQKNTKSEYRIYASAARLDEEMRKRAALHPDVCICEIPKTRLRGGREHSYYLEKLALIAMEQGCTHVVALHLDSFPIYPGWEEVLRSISDRTKACIAAEEFYSACLFFSKEFYERYRPPFYDNWPSAEYQEFIDRYRLINHSGTPFLYCCHREGLEWRLMKATIPSSYAGKGVLNGGILFHAVGALRLSPGNGFAFQKAPTLLMRAVALLFSPIQRLRSVSLLRRIWRGLHASLPFAVSRRIRRGFSYLVNLNCIVEKESSGKKLQKSKTEFPHAYSPDREEELFPAFSSIPSEGFL